MLFGFRRRVGLSHQSGIARVVGSRLESQPQRCRGPSSLGKLAYAEGLASNFVEAMAGANEVRVEKSEGKRNTW